METQDLIYLVSCAVNGEMPDPDRVAGMDFEALYKLASRHLIAATVTPALEAVGVRDDRFIKAKQHSIRKNATMDAEMRLVFAELDAAGIWHMPLKGIVLQHFYPAYGMRQMSDHDILFDADRAEEVKTIMENLGFQTKYFGSSSHDVYYKKPVSNFEMHRALFGLGHDEKLQEYYRDIQNHLIGDGYEKYFSPEDFYLYVTAHEYKHYSGGGTGLRSLLDIYVILKKEPLDLAYVAAEAEKMGMAEFEAANRSLAQHLFSGEELTEADRKMLDFMLSSGVNGTMDNMVQSRMSRNSFGKLRYALDRFFAPINKNSEDYARLVRKFPFIYRHRILLPGFMLYRVFSAMRSGRFKSEVKAIKNAKV